MKSIADIAKAAALAVKYPRTPAGMLYASMGGERYTSVDARNRILQLEAETRGSGNGEWRTIDGAHVFIEDGKITKGPAALRGKTHEEAKKHVTQHGRDKSDSRGTDSGMKSQYIGKETREDAISRWKIQKSLGLDTPKPKHGSEMGYRDDAQQKQFEHFLDSEYEAKHGVIDENDHEGMKAGGWEHAPDVIGPMVEDATTEKADEPAQRYAKASIERRLMEHYERTGGDYGAEGDDEYGHVASERNRTFHESLPGEVKTFLQGRRHLSRLFKVSSDPTASGGADAMHEMGEGRYLDAVENLGKGRIGRAIETAKHSDDPEMRFLAHVHERSGTGAKYIHMPTDKLQDGHSFTINGEKFHVEEPDEGQRVLHGPSHYPDIPLESMTHLPIDKGSLRRRREVVHAGDDVVPFSAGLAPEYLREQIILLSQGSLFGGEAYTGSQSSLFGGKGDSKGSLLSAEGHWVTIHGAHILIKHGESVGKALREHFKGRQITKPVTADHIEHAARQIESQGGKPNRDEAGERAREAKHAKDVLGMKVSAEEHKSKSTASSKGSDPVDTTRQLGMFAKDAKGEPTEVGEKAGQTSMFTQRQAEAAKAPAKEADPDAALRAKFDEKATPTFDEAGILSESPTKPVKHQAPAEADSENRVPAAGAAEKTHEYSPTEKGDGVLHIGLDGRGNTVWENNRPVNKKNIASTIEHVKRLAPDRALVGYRAERQSDHAKYIARAQLIADGTGMKVGELRRQSIRGHPMGDLHAIELRRAGDDKLSPADIDRMSASELEARIDSADVSTVNDQMVQDWGSRRGSGKRFGNGMVQGSMSDRPVGKKVYQVPGGKLADYADVKKIIGAMHPYMQTQYLKARASGLDHAHAEAYAFGCDTDEGRGNSLKNYRTRTLATSPSQKPIQLSASDPIARIRAAAVDKVLTLSAGPHSYSCCMVPIEGELADKIKAAGESIPDEDLADDGRETDPHVTALYGLHSAKPNGAMDVLDGERQFDMTAGDPMVFPATPDRESDVIVLPIESTDLHRINGKLSTLPHTNGYRDYKPHATIAYVKPGKGQEHAERLKGMGGKARASRIVFSGHDDERTDIPLADDAAVELSAADDDVLYLSASVPETPALTMAQGLPDTHNELPIHYRWVHSASVGDYQHPATAEPFAITPQRIGNWVKNIQKARARGVHLPIYANHPPRDPKNRASIRNDYRRAENTEGEIYGARQRGNDFDLLLGFHGDDALDLARKNKVSVGIHKSFKDAFGNHYGDAIEHVALTGYPVIPNQKGFLPN